MEELQLQLLLQKISEHADSAAFKQLYLFFFHRLKSFSYAITHSHEQAEEVVEEVLTQLWMQKKNLSSISNLNVYLYKSTHNISNNYLKMETGISMDRSVINMSVCKVPIATQLTGTELARPADHAIQMLAPQSKLIIKMAKAGKLNCKEIADILDTTPETIEGQLASALKTIGHVITCSHT